MSIGINILYLIPGRVGGTETYARELIAEMSKNKHLTLFCGRETASTFKESKNISIITLPIYSKNRIARIIAEQTLLPLLCFRYHVDTLFSLGYSAPLLHSFKSIVTIHDLNWYYHPEDFSFINRMFWEYLTRASAHFSDSIITDSSASKQSIIEVLHVKPSKVTSILHGTPATIKVKPHVSKDPYLFTVLANYPHKNLKTLLKAFEVLLKTNSNLKLLVCGLGDQEKSTGNVEYLGYVSREELCGLYMGASVFVFPSAYEGFGYPVLEAMSYGSPVVSSNSSSLAEVVGDGGMLVGPYDVDAYVRCITSILVSPTSRKNLIRKGRKRAAELQWINTAREMIKQI